jgi:hypothetical protein
LHPSTDKSSFRLRNLPSGEVILVPNENADSKTSGKIPVSYGDEIAVFVVQSNQIIDVLGDGQMFDCIRDRCYADQLGDDIVAPRSKWSPVQLHQLVSGS